MCGTTAIQAQDFVFRHVIRDGGATGPGTGRHPRDAQRANGIRQCVQRSTIDTGTATQRDGAFYRGKVAAAVFFAETVLPRLAADRVVIESQGLAAMELEEEAF
jgi:hypothetical protein